MSSYGSSKYGKCESLEQALEAYREKHTDPSKPVNIHYMHEMLSPSARCNKADVVAYLTAERILMDTSPTRTRPLSITCVPLTWNPTSNASRNLSQELEKVARDTSEATTRPEMPERKTVSEKEEGQDMDDQPLLLSAMRSRLLMTMQAKLASITGISHQLKATRSYSNPRKRQMHENSSSIAESTPQLTDNEPHDNSKGEADQSTKSCEPNVTDSANTPCISVATQSNSKALEKLTNMKTLERAKRALSEKLEPRHLPKRAATPSSCSDTMQSDKQAPEKSSALTSRPPERAKRAVSETPEPRQLPKRAARTPQQSQQGIKRAASETPQPRASKSAKKVRRETTETVLSVEKAPRKPAAAPKEVTEIPSTPAAVRTSGRIRKSTAGVTELSPSSTESVADASPSSNSSVAPTRKSSRRAEAAKHASGEEKSKASTAQAAVNVPAATPRSSRRLLTKKSKPVTSAQEEMSQSESQLKITPQSLNELGETETETSQSQDDFESPKSEWENYSETPQPHQEVSGDSLEASPAEAIESTNEPEKSETVFESLEQCAGGSRSSSPESWNTCEGSEEPAASELLQLKDDSYLTASSLPEDNAEVPVSQASSNINEPVPISNSRSDGAEGESHEQKKVANDSEVVPTEGDQNQATAPQSDNPKPVRVSQRAKKGTYKQFLEAAKVQIREGAKTPISPKKAKLDEAKVPLSPVKTVPPPSEPSNAPTEKVAKKSNNGGKKKKAVAAAELLVAGRAARAIKPKQVFDPSEDGSGPKRKRKDPANTDGQQSQQTKTERSKPNGTSNNASSGAQAPQAAGIILFCGVCGRNSDEIVGNWGKLVCQGCRAFAVHEACARMHRTPFTCNKCRRCTKCRAKNAKDAKFAMIECRVCKDPYHLRCVGVANYSTNWDCASCSAIFEMKKLNEPVNNWGGTRGDCTSPPPEWEDDRERSPSPSPVPDCSGWTSSQVYNYVETYVPGNHISKVFLDKDIDGGQLLTLSRRAVLYDVLRGFKLGPRMQVFCAVTRLQTRSWDITKAWNM